MSGLSTGNSCYIRLGLSNTTNSSIYMYFQNVGGSGSNTNAVGLGMTGNTPFIYNIPGNTYPTTINTSTTINGGLSVSGSITSQVSGTGVGNILNIYAGTAGSGSSNNYAQTSYTVVGSGGGAVTGVIYYQLRNGTYNMFHTNPNGSIILNPDNSSNCYVGIGSYNNPTYPLEITGQTNSGVLLLRNSSGVNGWRVGPDSNRVNGDLSGNFVIYNSNTTGVYLSNGGTSWTANSDRTLKKDISDNKLGIEVICKLEPKDYRYISDSDNSNIRTGFIAQEVQEILPNIVDVSGDNKLGIRMVDIIPYLVNAVKEQQDLIKGLQQQINDYKANHP
jgi:hypothetical protein